MNNISYTKEAAEVIRYSKEEAARTEADSICPEHLLLGIIRAENNKAAQTITSLYGNLRKIRRDVEELMKNDEDYASRQKTELRNLYFNEQTTRILKLSYLESKLDEKDSMDTEHILLGIMKETNNKAAEVLESNNITYQKIKNRLSDDTSQALPSSGMSFDEDEYEDDGIGRKSGNSRPEHDKPSQNRAESAAQTKKQHDGKLLLLDKYGTDLTAAAAEGKLDKIVGREKETERIAQILSRRKKNNPVLIGEPGVGKSAVVEGLATRIAQKKVSRILFDKKIIMLDLTALVAGTKYRGEFEERILGVIKEVKQNPDVILFIDEIHTIIGAGSAAGSMDAANILKPALARGELQCIGATTLDEYRKSIEKDGAMERRFQKVMIEPSTSEETLQILMNIKEQYEEFHNVEYTEDAIKACVQLTERYITDRSFPDKAIDALDEAGSRVHLSNISVPKEIEDQELLIAEANKNKNEAISLQNFEMAANLRDKEKALQIQLENMKEAWLDKMKENRETVDKAQIEEVVSMMSGVPASKIGDSETGKLKMMKEALSSKVVGQDKAVDTLVRAIKRSRTGLKDPNKPIGTFLFTGPTGVGKTHLAKALAEELFGSKDSLIRIDMSEYMDKYTVSRMVGAPPGYVGYDEGGQLTEKVRRKPYSIVLLDEIEKAHPDVFNFLLQIMDEGRLTDNSGRTVDFKNTVIIMTSNVGSRQVKDFGRGIGFNATVKEDSANAETIVKKALEKTFAPEFINRIDEIIPFHQLDIDALMRITDIELAGLVARVENMGYKLCIDDAAKKFIAQKGEDVHYGARPIKRAIQTNIEDKLAEFLMDNELENGCGIEIGVNNDNTEIEVNGLK